MARGTGRFDAGEFRRRRLAAGLSQQRVAEAVGTTRQQIIAYEQGHSTPEPARLAALAAAVGCAPAVLSGMPAVVDLAGLRRAAGMTRAQAVTRLADVLGDRAPATRWLLAHAETGRTPAAWRSAARQAAVVAAMTKAYGVPIGVVAQAWPESASPVVRTPLLGSGEVSSVVPGDPPDQAKLEAGRTVAPPDPRRATTLDGLTERLRMLKAWAGDPSYETIRQRVRAAWVAAGRHAAEMPGRTTVVDCFRTGRRRMNADLVTAIVQALHPDVGYVAQWRQALQVIGGESGAQVRVQDRLPPKLDGFTGRTAELARLCRRLGSGRRDGGPAVISAIEGMAGVGKTQLAVHAGHLLLRERSCDQVLFVNLRGFHPDPAQPPADPAAVLEGFLRLLGVRGQRIPHDLEGRATLYRRLLADRRALVVLDNAATTEQVRPLLPDGPECFTLITSRPSLTDLHPAIRLSVDVFTLDEAAAYLARAVPEVPAGSDRHAAARIAARCGYLPLALSLVTGHIRNTPGWTLTDHADRLDERHHHRHLDTGVELALTLSYQHLPAGQRRLLRLAALHPGQDFHAYAAAALADTDLPTAQDGLSQLCRDHLLQQSTPGRYTFHDLVRTYVTLRASDEERPAERRTALTRLFDHYLATAAAAMNTLHPGEAHNRPAIRQADNPTPDLTDPDTAREWLDTERAALVAVAAHTASHGWPTHTTWLSRTLYRYLDGGYHTDALTVHGHADHAAHHSGDPAGQAQALTNLGVAHYRLGRYKLAGEHLQHALELFRRACDSAGEARALGNLGLIAIRTGRYRTATNHYAGALTAYRQAGDRTGEARTLNNLGELEGRLGRRRPAVEHHEQALALYRQAGSRRGEAATLNSIGELELRWGRYGQAGDCLRQALALYRQLGSRSGEASTLDNLGILHTRLGQPDQATEHHQRALTIVRGTGDRYGEAFALNGLGEAANTAGRAADALTHHTAAHTTAIDIDDRDQQARAHTGLGHAHHALGDPALAHHHYQQALTLYTDLGQPEAEQIRNHLAQLATPDNKDRHSGNG